MAYAAHHSTHFRARGEHYRTLAVESPTQLSSAPTHSRDSSADSHSTAASDLTATITTASALSMSDSSKAPSSLASLPAAWLQRLAATLNPRDRLQLARTCHSLLQAVLSNHPLTLRLGRGSSPKSVQLACRHCPAVHLVLDCHNLDPKQLLGQAAEQLNSPLRGIERMTLQVGPRHRLKSPFLQHTCPNLTSLTINWAPSDDRHHVRTHTYAQVKQLHAQQALHHLQDQLHALPALQSLTVNQSQPDDDDDDDDDIVPLSAWLSCCSATTQLAYLHLPRPDPRLPRPSLVYLHLDLPHLSNLRLPGVTLYDTDVDVLISMPNLRVLQCQGFHLTGAHRSTPSPWTHLSVEAFDVHSFAQMDLSHLISLKAVCDPATQRVTVKTSADQLGVELFKALVSRCGGINWSTIDQYKTHMWLDASAGGVMHVLPTLLSFPSTRCTLWRAVCTAQSMAELGMQLPHRMESVTFHECVIGDGCGRALVRSLPERVRELGFSIQYGGQVAQEELGDVCLAAERKLLVVVWGGPKRYGAGWALRVHAAMRAAGQLYVSLLDEGDEVEEDDEGSDWDDDDEGEHHAEEGVYRY